MNFLEIKKFLKKEGGKVLILEDGEPFLVVMDYQEYQKLKNIDQEFDEEETFLKQKEESQKLTLDDLPL
jgi:translation elongation factor P/translation initiation factor 5A